MKNIMIPIVTILICSAFIYTGDGHPPVPDRDSCTSCHTELLEPFESYTADMRLHIPTNSVVVVLAINGDICTVSGIEFVGDCPCSELLPPLNWEYPTSLAWRNPWPENQH